MAHTVELPPPRDWQVFEDLCRDLFAAEWDDPEAQKHGRSGQPQHGVDVLGRRNGRWQAVQCKRRSTFPERQLKESEVEAEVEASKEFAQPLENLVIATTAPPDTRLQVLAMRLTEEHGDDGPRVVIYGWSELSEKLQGHPEVYETWHRKLMGSKPLKAMRREVHSGVQPVPRLPKHYLPRPEDLAPLRRALIESGTEKLGITGIGSDIVGVQGMGGIGKTVLAAAICHDPAIETAFVDGVIWITFGQEPNIPLLQLGLAERIGILRDLLKAIEMQKALAKELDTEVDRIAVAKRELEKALAKRPVLLVLDDVWDPRHACEFDFVGAAGRLLVTTRNREILVGLGAEEIQLDVLTAEQSLRLLAEWAGVPADRLPAIAGEVAEECGYLPLALAMIGAMVQLEPTAWSDTLERLQRADLDKIRRMFGDYPYPNLLRALEVSVEALDPGDRKRYLELAVFQEDMSMSTASIEVLWSETAGLSGIETRDLIRSLVARSLAQRDQEGGIRLHDLQGDYVRQHVPNLPELQRRFLSFNGINGATGAPLLSLHPQQLVDLFWGIPGVVAR